MSKKHQYRASLEWTGNRGEGTRDYRSYDRNHVLRFEGKPDLLSSSDPAYAGDPARHNPEDMLLGSLAGCHMLWYLHLCSDAGIIVTAYQDEPSGTMEVQPDGSGRFAEVTLRPVVTITDGTRREEAMALHARANQMCFIANSCNFPVHHEAECREQTSSVG